MNNEQKNTTVPKLRFPEFVSAKEWSKTTLGEVTFPVSEKNKDGKKYPIYSINNVEGFLPQFDQFEGVDSHNRGYDVSLYKVIGEKTFAYNPARINVGSIGYSGALKDIIISSLYVCFKTTETLVDSFLLQFLKTKDFNESVRKNVEGGIRNYLFYENFSRINLYLPSPEEQQKIANCLSSLDDLITAENQKLEALKAHKKGLMQQLFPAEGETVPKLRFEEFKASRNWEEKRLGSICSSIASGKDKGDSEGLYDLYGSTGIIGKTNNFSYEGDYLLIARVGANAGFINRVNGRFGVTDNTLVVTLQNSQNIDFIHYSLERFGLNKLSFGSGQPLITGSLLKDLLVHLPEPAEQKMIASCLSSLDDFIITQVEKIEALSKHKKGLMQGLFPNLTDVME